MSALFGTLWGTPGGEGGGSATVNGDGINTTQAVEGTPLMFDIEDVSRPVAVDLRPDGNVLRVSTATDANAFLDADDPAWTTVREDSFATIEFVTAKPIKGVQVRRTVDNGGSSSVRVYAPLRGPGYNPTYNPSYDVAPAGLNDTRRFLDQATMGPLALEAASFSGTFGAWMDAQRLLTLGGSVQVTWPDTGANSDSTYAPVASGLLETYVQNAAQLRIKMGHAIGQIVVVGPASGSASPNLISWWDRMFENALGNFKDILRMSWMHRAMGKYLNNDLNNARNQAPSQNYARELVQLFSTGTFLLNKDGSVQLDGDGKPLPAYTQEDVNAIARYSCGWGIFPALLKPGESGSPSNGDMTSYAATYGYNGPMVPLFGKTDADYPSFAQFATPTEMNIIDRREACLELIMAHPSTGPYVCKQLIQKLVTDSPTPQYIRRVVAAWDDNGSGVVGDLYHVARAILLDVEARGNSKAATFGRVPDPILSLTRRMRYAQAQVNNFTTRTGLMWATHLASNGQTVSRDLGEYPGVPVSVFNNYPFSYQIAGVEAPAAATWGSPAFLANFSVALSSSTFIADPAAMGANDQVGRCDCTGLIALYDATSGSAADKAAAIIDRAYADLFQGAAPAADVRAEIVALLASLHSSGLTTRAKCTWLVQFLMCTPRAAVIV